jgi:toxin CcdB
MTIGAKCVATPMQHDVFENPTGRFQAAFPFIAELQADIAEGRDRMVAPMALVGSVPSTPARLSPIVQHGGSAFYLVLPLMGLLPRTRLTKPVGTIKQHRDDIVRAIDWLFTGV